MDHAKLLDVLTSLPVSRSILPRAVYFATSRPANHVICSFIDSSGYASGPIRRCLFIDYIIIYVIRVKIGFSHGIHDVVILMKCMIYSSKYEAILKALLLYLVE